MKKICYLLIIFQFCSLHCSFFKKDEPGYQEAKHGWQALRQFQFQKACSHLQTAVEQGNIRAALFLAESYQSGGCATGKDNEQAELFADLAEILKEDRKQQRIEEDRKFHIRWFGSAIAPSSDMATCDHNHFIKKLEAKNKRLQGHLEGHFFARDHEFYQKVIKILQEAHEEKQKEERCFWLRKKRFKMVPLSEGTCALFDLYVKDKVKKEDEYLLFDCIKHLDDQSMYEKILRWFTDDLLNDNHGKKTALLPLIHTWALAHGRQRELDKVYEEWISFLFWLDYHNNCRHIFIEGRKQAVNQVVDLLPFYHTISVRGALESLRRLLSLEISYLYEPYWKCRDAALLRCLACARRLDNDLFQKYAKEILEKKLGHILFFALESPKTMKELEGSELATAHLIDAALNDAVAVDHSKSHGAAFETFLTQGEVLHGKYQQRIQEVLSTALMLHPNIWRGLFTLLQSPLPTLRTTAFKTIVDYITNRASDRSRVTYCMRKKLFKRPMNNFVDSGKSIDAYRAINEICMHNDSIATLQMLWMRLGQEPQDSAERELLVQSIGSFFNLKYIDSPSMAFDVLLNRSLCEARDTIAPACLHAFLIHAVDTGLSKLFTEDINCLLK